MNTVGIELHRRRRGPLAVLTLVVGVALGPALTTGVPSYAASAAGTTTSSPAAAPRAEGRWVSFRTTESDREPTAAHTAACREHLGPVLGQAVPIQLEADLFSFTTGRRDAVVRDETARRVGRGYLCTSGPDPADTADPGTNAGYAVVRLPGVGRVEALGGCELIPEPSQPGTAFFNCRLRLLPDPAHGVVGGFVTSNSVLNPAQVPGNATGSIWTAYVERTAWPTSRHRSPHVPGLVAGDVSGARVTFASTRGHPRPVTDASCTGTAERVRLTRVQSRLRTSLFPVRQRGHRAGVLRLCAPAGSIGTFETTGTVRVTGPLGDPVTLPVSGTCRTPSPHGSDVRACTLEVTPDPTAGVQGGFVTTIGPDRPASRVTGHRPVVTVALLPVAAGQQRARAPRRPGTLLSAHRLAAQSAPGVPLAGARAWRVRYLSRDLHGALVPVTGTVLVPDAAPATALVGFAAGTQGLADRCAVSHQLAAGTEYEIANIGALLARGYAVAVSDYPGLGTRPEHTYVVGEALGRSVLDSMRAARQLRRAHLGTDLPTAVTGYSEGGGAAGWVAQIAPAYAPDLALRAVAVGGVVADLPATFHYVDGGPVSFLTAYTLSGFIAEYPHRHLGRSLTPRGHRVLDDLRDTCIDEAAAHYPPLTRARELTRVPVLQISGLRHLLRHQSLGRTAPTMPVLLQHSPTDEVLPYAAATALATTWTDAGADVDFRPVAGDHVTAGFAADQVAYAWLAEHLAP
ncbi:hypothetical protein H5V45_19605 [Nocardioides sp. KIGAM211]|uniref:Lipase n=1 Tax=Nocardioides luti TaxID=2761101 RepID=A0A7X0RLT3_9ACTN|nr:lipase family protein [Nocardioides luti]MBB6629540.1 hypothetical protein [Nocardioides luti]